MEKLTFKDIQNTEEFKKGLREFREGKVPPQSIVKYSWYRKIVSGGEWKDKHAHSGYTILSMKRDGKSISEVEFAFMSTNSDNGCLEITNYDDLLKIDNHRKAINHLPFVFEDKIK